MDLIKETVSTITDCATAGKDGYDRQAGIEAPGDTSHRVEAL